VGVMMCPGKEFFIMDTIAGIIFGGIVYVMAVVFGLPWYMWFLFLVSTIGWFGMAIYAFRFWRKCNCQEIYKKLGIK
jgi:hypothetical protein